LPEDTVGRINKRFMEGKASDDLSSAGVVIRQLDAMVDNGQLDWWFEHDEEDGWMRTPGPWGQTFYSHLRDRLAASVVNVKLPFMYSTSAVGFVLRPSELALWCSYPRDGNSMNEDDHGCGGHGTTGSFDSLKSMMKYHEKHLHFGTSCLWGAPDAEDRSGCRYNELVLDGERYAARLPFVIEAIFFPVNGVVHHEEGSESQARILHRRFARTYGMIEGECDGCAPPLLRFDVQDARNGKRPPFRMVLDA
jgi:hypothetical protein